MTFLSKLSNLKLTKGQAILLLALVIFVCSSLTVFASSHDSTTGVNGGAPTTVQGSGAENDVVAKDGETDSWWALAWTAVLSIVHSFFTVIGAMLVWIAGLLLNFSIQYFIVEMGSLINNDSGIGFAINNVWTVVRDLMNMAFIFGLVYIGIKTILNSEDSGTRRTLGLLILAALLVNFSLFISKAVIDFTNVAAVQVVNLMVVDDGTQAANFAYSGISGAFTDLFGIQQLISDPEILQMITDSNGPGAIAKPIGYMFASFIFLIITAIVFAAGAFMVTARFISLILYMIFSPVMFLGWVLPTFSSYSKKWWGGFFQQAFFAPAFMFMLYISLQVSTQFFYYADDSGTVVSGNRNLSASLSGDTAFFAGVLGFALGIGMLVASIIVAKQMGMAGADTTMGALKGVKNSVQGFVGRNTLGRLGAAHARRIEENEGTWGGRMRNRLVTAASLGAFDTQARHKAFKAAESSNFGGSRSLESNKKWEQERAKMQSGHEDVNALYRALEQGTGNHLTKKARENALINMEDTIAKTGADELVEMAKTKQGRAMIAKAAGSIDQAKFDKVTSSDKLTPAQIGELKAGRKASVIANITRKGDGDFKKGLKKATNNELNALDFKSDIIDNAMYLQGSQIEKMEDKWGTEKFGLLVKAHEDQINKAVKNRDYEGVIASRKDKKELAKLPKEVLENPAFIAAIETSSSMKLDTELLNHIANESKADKETVGEAYLRAKGVTGTSISGTDAATRSYFGAGRGSIFLPSGWTV